MLPQRIEEELEFDVDEAPPEGRPERPPRVYRLRDAVALLLFFGLTLLLLDGDGLHAWVTRMDVGPAQDFWASLVEPWRQLTARAGLGTPRRLALETADRLAAKLAGGGGNEDLLARGWTPERDPAPAAPPPRDPALLVPPTPPAPPENAQEAPPAKPAPPAGADPQAPPGPSEGPSTAAGLTSILLLGDSLMVTMAPSIHRAFEDQPGVKVIAADRSATGLSRPDVYDWQAVASTFVATHHPRLVVCSFGGNDAQDVRAPDGKVLHFGSEAWDALYAERIRAMMALLEGSGAEVLWLGLPPMRAHAFDGKMQHLNTLYAQEAAASAHVTFEETNALVGDKDGRFVEYLRSPRGKLVRVRTGDGIHYADDGAQRVAERVKSWVDERLAAKTTAAAPGDVTRTTAAAPSDAAQAQ